MTAYVAVAAGGALGAMARYWIGALILDRAGRALPWDTMVINIAGSFLIGALGPLAIESGLLSVTARRFLLIGLLGGFTTFSTLSFEFQRYVEDGDHLSALAYLLLTIVGGLSAAFAGAALARTLH